MSAGGSVGEGRGMTMEAMQGAVEQLTKGQELITKQIGLLIGAVALKQGQPVSSAPRVQPPGHKWVLETLDADEGSSEAQKQQERAEHARGLAKCKASLPGFNRNPMTSSSRSGGIRAAIADVQDIAIASGVEYLLLPDKQGVQTMPRRGRNAGGGGVGGAVPRSRPARKGRGAHLHGKRPGNACSTYRCTVKPHN